MKPLYILLVAAFAGCLLAGTVVGRAFGIGDAEARGAFDQAAADQERSLLRRRIQVLEDELKASQKDGEALSQELGAGGPSLDLGDALDSAQAKLATLEGEMKKAEAEAKATLARGRAEVEGLKQEKQRLEGSLQRESANLRRENQKLREEVRKLRQDVGTLNETIRGLKSFKNPFRR